MKQKSGWQGLLILLLCWALATPARAQSGGEKIVSNGTIVGVIVGVVAAVAVLAIVAIHYSKKRTITGCVSLEGSGLTITDEKDNQPYTLTGNTGGIKPGDRMKVQGKKVESKGSNKNLVWETKAVSKDFGVCHP